GLVPGPSGTIYAAASLDVYDAYVLRLTSAGALDTTFATTGAAKIPAVLSFGGLATTSDGKPVVPGSPGTLPDTEGDAVVVRLGTDGTADATWGTAGTARANAQSSR